MPTSASTRITLSRAELCAYSLQEVADALQVSTRTVTRMLDSGELKSVRPRKAGRPVRITAASLRSLLDPEGGAE